MAVTCKLERYEIKAQEDCILVYNGHYTAPASLLMAIALLEIFLPDREMFDIPLALRIEPPEDGTEIVIDKKLNVTGAARVTRFIPKSHYDKWKKSYAAANALLAGMGMALSLLMWFIFVVLSDYNPIIGACTALVVLLTLFLTVKLVKQHNLVKKYEVLDGIL